MDGELGSCGACGASLCTRRVCFAQCVSCRAENYRPVGDLPLEERVARFWRRRMGSFGNEDASSRVAAGLASACSAT